MSEKILLVGEPMGLFIAQQEGPLESMDGFSVAVAGAEYNVAVGMRRLGHAADYVTRLGNDPFGKRVAKGIEQNGIDTRSIIWSDARLTGFMLKSHVSTGDPEVFYYRKNSAASTICPDDIEGLDLSAYHSVHMTGILPALSESCLRASFRLMERAREAGLYISFDPNLRPALWESRSWMVRQINALAHMADLVLPGEGEGEILVGSRDPREIAHYYLSGGTKTVVVKLGGRGAYAATGTEEYMVEGFPVKEVVDTVGAGDGFAVGVLSALMEGASLPQAVRQGNAIGAIQIMSVGDNEGLPTREQLDRFMGRL